MDLALKKLDIQKECKTMIEPLPDSRGSKWIKPGYSAKKWVQDNDVNDPLLCECEMVSQSVVDSLIDDGTSTLKVVGNSSLPVSLSSPLLSLGVQYANVSATRIIADNFNKFFVFIVAICVNCFFKHR